MLEYCLSNQIQIKRFYHTFKNDYLKLLTKNSVVYSQKLQKDISTFFESYRKAIDNIICDFDKVNCNSKSIVLFDDVELSFLSPSSADERKLLSQQVKSEVKSASLAPDFNLVSTVIRIGNKYKYVLLTSDAPSRIFNRIKEIIIGEAQVIQVPHHGSSNNHNENFWSNLKYINNCPSVYSVGDLKKDKLPNFQVVSFFEKSKYCNYSTNYVHGLREYYEGKKEDIKGILLLDNWSKKSIPNNLTEINLLPRFYGDKHFILVF